MYKFLLFFLFIPILKSYAQKDIINVNTGLKEGMFNPIKTNVIKDSKLGLTCVLANDTVKVKGIILNNSLVQEQEFEMYGLDNKKIIGGYIHNNLVSVFANEEGSLSIKNIIYNLNTKKTVVYDIFFKLFNEKLLGQINSDSSILYITANKKEPKINVYKFSENRIDTLIYDFNNISGKSSFNKKDLWLSLTKQEGLGRSVDVAIVKPDVNCDLDVANSPNKLYLVNNNLFLLMDKVRGVTMVFKLNLNNQEIDYKKIKHSLEASTQTIDFPTFNSYLLENRLYYIDASLQKLTLIINDFNTGLEIKRYQTLASDSIKFKNTPVLLEGSLYSMGETRELGKTIQLLRKMVRGRSVIVASKRGDNHELIIGAFKEIKQSGGGMMMGGGFGSVPIYVGVGIGRTWNQLTRFKSLFDPVNNNHLTGMINLSALEKLQNFVELTDFPQKSINMFSLNDNYYLTYFSKKDNTLRIKLFEKD